ncbi:putative salicylate hydroxylase [Ilyonectria robusta]|uniref:putative salicylate hydroxylase n=1 Tax=Ilyonectria robusta TaxID=1079257 RepID=UPI001E8D63E8|nr:putative salicylate hydroxylase [Ilyonectria robusta]KAH8664831.1 putative salicylate hydroxylase [Ilyonectria robusta]
MSSQAESRLRVVIVGAGELLFTRIGGVAAAVALGRCGHQVVILENAPELLEIGAGIQVAPNMLRLLDRWGIGDEIRAKGVKTQRVKVLRWQNGKVLSDKVIDGSHGEQWVIHRADLHNALIAKAQSFEGVTMRLNSTVVDVNFRDASVQLSTGEWVYGDVVLAADGIKSAIRKLLLDDDSDIAIPTGDAVFRLILPRDLMAHDPELLKCVTDATVRRWVGPGGHIVAYPVRNHQLYNIAMAHPDRGGLEESWTTRGSKEMLLKEYEGWDPLLVKMLTLVPDEEVMEWKLCSHPPLKTWTRGSCALLGDACHPMLPYVAQGAAQAVEDAAALGVILSSVKSKLEIPTALEFYQRTRKLRAETVQNFGTETRASLHLADGPEQIARDTLFATRSNPDRWNDAASQQYLWSFDAEREAQGSAYVREDRGGIVGPRL